MCSIEGCTKPKRTRGLCNAHYERWRKHGTTGPPSLKPWGVTGCKVPGCDRPHRSNGYCTLHRQRWATHGDPLKVIHPGTNTPPRYGASNPAWTGDDATYGSAHNRLRQQRGPAGDHPCQHCGRMAAHWAYDHQCPDERTGTDHGRPAVYSLNPDHYMPLCVRCHRHFDVEHGSLLFGRVR